MTAGSSLWRVWPECWALALEGLRLKVTLNLEASLRASLSTVPNMKFNQLMPFECQLCAALGPEEGRRVLCVTDWVEGLGVTFPSGQESQGFCRPLT